uniref:Uncharacterized protein n=1 Tax=Panagrolaimus sp. ES5 TaxID=591445 RepID=A0AC34F0V4_9BILA
MVVGRAGGFAKRRQSVATLANRPSARRSAAQPAKTKSRKPPNQNQQHYPSPDPKSSEAEASSSSAPPTTTRRAPTAATSTNSTTSKTKLSSDSSLFGGAASASTAVPIKRKDATVCRRSADFSNIVLEAARRASGTGSCGINNGGGRRGTTDSSNFESGGTTTNFEVLRGDRRQLLHRQPSIEEVAETESTVSIGSSLFTKQHSLIENSPRRRR